MLVRNKPNKQDQKTSQEPEQSANADKSHSVLHEPQLLHPLLSPFS